MFCEVFQVEGAAPSSPDRIGGHGGPPTKSSCLAADPCESGSRNASPPVGLDLVSMPHPIRPEANSGPTKTQGKVIPFDMPNQENWENTLFCFYGMMCYSVVTADFRKWTKNRNGIGEIDTQLRR